MNALLKSPYFEQFSLPAWLINEVNHSTEQEKDVNETEVNKITTQCLIIEETSNSSYICYLQDEKTPQYELLLKMLVSIGLTKEHITCIRSNNIEVNNDVNNYDTDSILLLGQQLNSNMVRKQDITFCCYHPNDILANTKLKRDAWVSLKQLKLHLDKRKES